jgi:hypothetical protein
MKPGTELLMATNKPAGRHSNGAAPGPFFLGVSPAIATLPEYDEPGRRTK